MFLKSLTLKGFKSFADTTQLDMEPGVTVVVGPNGSGKSNVVDAIGWVLGAQAPSAVRSQKMDDVIFAGTSKRPALGRAEVGLTIDNSEGLLPIDFSEVSITRTLFRSGDSEYAINGVGCRLLDVQELLSDSGVGRQQHVIISQGQIDAVLNARPEDRRLIIEEAAGVLKHRRRKEKSERRLAATEVNLLRIQDLSREVRRQLRPLERQADAARRHGSLVSELTELRVFVAGQELNRLQSRLTQQASNRQQLTTDERKTRSELSGLDTDVLATEAHLSALGGEDLGDELARSESLREKARGLATLLAERRRGVERDRGAQIDRAVIATLEAEAAGLHNELAEVQLATEQLEPDAAQLAEQSAELEAARGRFAEDWDGFEPVAPGGRAAEIRGELGALRAGVERGKSEAERAATRLQSLESKAQRLQSEAERLGTEVADAQQAEELLKAGLAAAQESAKQAETDLSKAEDVRRAADGEHRSWLARAEALALALDEARSRAGAERLAAIDGVLGTLLDLVEVDNGWESAFEAAAANALASVVVRDGQVAREAIDALRAADETGAVLPMGQPQTGSPEAAHQQTGTSDGLRSRVRAIRPGVDELLDRLIGGVLVAESWTEALDLVGAHPAVVVVTPDGDRFAPSGWRVGKAGAGATGAALEEARKRGSEASGLVESATHGLAKARAAMTESRAAEQDASRALDQNRSALRSGDDAVKRVQTDGNDASNEAENLQVHVRELQERLQRDSQRVDELVAELPALEEAESAATAQARAMAQAREDIEERATAVGALRRDHELKAASIEERTRFLTRRLSEIDSRLARDVAERQAAEARRLEIDRRATATDRLSALVAERLGGVEALVADLRERRRQQSEASRGVSADLNNLRRARGEAEKVLVELRERLQRAEIEEAEVTLRIENAVEALRRDLDLEPAAAQRATAPELPEGVSPVARIRELERELRLMGPINPLALEEFEALQERNHFLEGQLEDIKSTRRELNKVIRAIDGEIVNVFAAAFADVSMNFAALFETLFPGGRGRLQLTQPDDLLATGIEIEAKPSGKNVKKLSLLSGGERSLTALAYLFAVFRSRPSPFYVMDEVEAALDDVNLHRFLDLVHEFRRDAQLIIVSHQKRTMEAADCLYGVTMEPGGSSKVLSEKVGSDL